MADERLSNVIGAPFAEHVLTQLNLRAAHNSTGQGSVPTRSPEEILFLANKSAWVKLTSSVRITPDPAEFYKKLELGVNYANPEDLAKAWILESGTSIANGVGIDLRKGIGPEGAYGMGGTDELGYRPMPGLTSVTIDTKGVLGSLREATISFKVWNMNQLNVIEALYFRLGYSMLLEWGHTQFYTNQNKTGNGGTFATNSYGINPFIPGLRKENIQQQIAKHAYDFSGNYDGMLGIVSNFHWSFNQEGGYDCTVRLVGLGAIIDSIRTNLSYRMPNTLYESYKSQQELLAELQAIQNERDKQKELDKQRAAEGLPPLVAAATNNEGIKAIIASDNGVSNVTNVELAKHALPTFYSNTTVDYYYKAVKGGKTSNKAYATELNTKRTGLFLNPLPGVRSVFQVLYAENPQSIILSKDVFNYTATKALEALNVETSIGGRYETSDLAKAFGIDTPIKLFGLRLASGETATNFYFKANIINPKNSQAVQDSTYIKLTYQQPSSNAPTTEEVLDALQRWFAIVRKVRVDSLSEGLSGYGNRTTVKGTLEDLVLLNGSTKTPPVITVEFNNTALIQTVTSPTVVETVAAQTSQTANTGDENGVDNSAANTQTDPAQRFASSLHAMLAAVKSQIQVGTSPDPTQGVFKVPLKDLTEAFYQDGILENIFNTRLNTTTKGFDVKQYALKGFNSNMMVDHKLFYSSDLNDILIPTVNFEKLATGYGIRYTVQDEQNNINFPTYIKFGYLMAFLNNMCLIYDSVQDTDKHPYVYLDFNPSTNFCLTNPQHLSVDPYICMIPFNGSREDYLKIFPPDLIPNSKGDNSIFNPNINAVSSYLPEFKSNPYQGKTMEILLNIDFLTDTLNQYTTSNSEHAINLKGFLDAIVNGINKATGNLNLFRVAYRDDSNTVIIKDDQFVPPAPNEAWALRELSEPSNYQVPYGITVPKYGQLPIFGKQSLVRAMQFETDLSTNVSNVIAISGQSDTKAVNSTDHSSFSYLNTNFQDAYKPKVSNSSNSVAKTSQNQQQLIQEAAEDKRKVIEHDLDQATQFNAHIISIYYGGYPLAKAKIPFATNYYINSMANVKSTDNITLGAPFIPANLSVTIDGISGIVMGNAFTIPEDRLPASLRGDGGFKKNTKVGFVVVGLTHTVQQNQWLTKIRGQMIRLRDSSDYGVVEQIQKIQTAFPSAVPTSNSIITSVDLSALNLNESWLNIAFKYVSSKEGFKAQAKFDITKFRGGYGSDNFITPTGESINVTSSTVFTVEDATRTLKANLAGSYKQGVINQIGKDKWEALNDRQKAALVSYVYNAGPGALSTWNIKKAIMTNQPASQVAQFIGTGPVTAGGVVYPGLVTRRAEEAKLYLS